MIGPIKGADRLANHSRDDELVKKQRKLLVKSLVKDFYPSKFSAGQIMQERETLKSGER